MIKGTVFGMKLMLLLIISVRLVMSIPEFSHLSIEQRHIVKCVTNIVGRYFIDGESILVSLPWMDYRYPEKERYFSPRETSSSVMILAESIIISFTDMNWPVYLINPSKELNSGKLRQFLRDKFREHTFHRYIIGFVPFDRKYFGYFSLMINPRPETLNIIIQASRIFDTGKESAAFILWLLSSKKVYKSIFITPISDENNSLSNANNIKVKTLLVYSWQPFERPDDCGDFNGVSLINEWIIDGDGGFIKDIDIFTTKLPSKFKGCPINILLDSFYSNDSFTSSPVLRYTQKEFLNFVTNVLNLKQFPIESTSSFDLYVTSIPLNVMQELTVMFTFTFPYLTTQIKWYVPCPKRITEIGNFVKVYSWSLWAVIFLTTLCMPFCIWSIYKIGRNTAESQNYRGISSCFLNVWAVLVGTSVVEWPLSLRVRTVLIFWAYFSYMISIVFQAFFTSFLVEPGHSKQISTVAELNKSGIKKIAPDYEGYVWSLNISEMILDNKFGSSDKYITQFLNNEDTAMLASVADMNMVSTFLGNRFRFCSIEDRSLTVYFGIVFVKSSIFLKPFSVIVGRLFESGLFGKFQKDFQMKIKNDALMFDSVKPLIETLEKVRKNSTHLMENAIGDEFFIFSISHMRVAFYLLLVGYTISLLVFVIEKIY